MSINKLEKELSASVGALSGLNKNNNNNTNHNSKDNNNNNANHNSKDNNNNNANIENIVKDFKSKIKKRTIKNSTYGLYEDQIESIREIANKLDVGINEFMREGQDILIDLFKKDLGL